ncbi:MAG: hypothetical protein IT518_14670 [Burkholderiales bacterium]|nr:hypothetical protein [Burkholderiales bacterium]
MHQDQILLELGKIAGKLGEVANTQGLMMQQLNVVGDGQARIIGEIGELRGTQVEHGRRLQKNEADISGLKTQSTRNATLIGALAGTGVTIIAEGIRQFLRMKS